MAQELCTPGQADALLAWPGCTRAGERSWPRGLVQAGALLGKEYVLARSINHVKVELGVDGTRRAKAYLWFGPRVPGTAAWPA